MSLSLFGQVSKAMSSLETQVTQCCCEQSSSPGRDGQAPSSADTCSQGVKKPKADSRQAQRKAFNKSKRPQIQSEMQSIHSALLCALGWAELLVQGAVQMQLAGPCQQMEDSAGSGLSCHLNAFPSVLLQFRKHPTSCPG